jgi:hypothetical protein
MQPAVDRRLIKFVVTPSFSVSILPFTQSRPRLLADGPLSRRKLVKGDYIFSMLRNYAHHAQSPKSLVHGVHKMQGKAT